MIANACEEPAQFLIDKVKSEYDLTQAQIERLITHKEEGQINVKIEHFTLYKELEHKKSVILGAFDVYNSGLLIQIFSAVDEFLRRLATEIHVIEPKTAAMQSITVSLYDLSKITDTAAYVRSELSKQLDEALRGDYKSKFIEICKMASQPFDPKGSPYWKDFFEASQRRHVFVHANKSVTHKYLEKCAQESVPNLPPLHTRLSCDRNYLTSTLDAVEDTCLRFWGYIATSLLGKDKLSDISDAIHRRAYDLLRNKQWSRSVLVGEYLVQHYKVEDLSDRSFKINVINLSQAYKWKGNQRRAIEIIDKYDWSACSKDFSMSLAAIKDDFDFLIENLDEVSCPDIFMWPVFRVFRESTQFKNHYIEHFGPLVSVDLEEELIFLEGAYPVKIQWRQHQRI